MVRKSKKGVYEYMLLIHFSVQQKLIQHCKANKPELKKEKRKKTHSVQCTCLSISDAVRFYAIFKYKELMSYRPSNSMCYKDPRLHFKNMTRVVMKTSTAFLMLLCGFSFQVHLRTNLRTSQDVKCIILYTLCASPQGTDTGE